MNVQAAVSVSAALLLGRVGLLSRATAVCRQLRSIHFACASPPHPTVVAACSVSGCGQRSLSSGFMNMHDGFDARSSGDVANGLSLSLGSSSQLWWWLCLVMLMGIQGCGDAGAVGPPGRMQAGGARLSK